MQRHKFRKFYNQHLDQVYRYIYFRVGGKQQVAEDLTSDVFFKALEHMETIDEEKSPTAWIYTVARNRLKNYYRDSKQETDIDTLQDTLDDGVNLEEVLHRETVVSDLLDKLSQEDRRVIWMKYIEGFSYKEIASILKKAPGAVRVSAHRAIKKLRTAYEDK